MIFDMMNQTSEILKNIQNIFSINHENKINNLELIEIYLNSLNLPLLLINDNSEIILKNNYCHLPEHILKSLQKEINDNFKIYFSNTNSSLVRTYSPIDMIEINTQSISINKKYLLINCEMEFIDKDVQLVIEQRKTNLLLPLFFLILKNNKIKFANNYSLELMNYKNHQLHDLNLENLITEEDFEILNKLENSTKTVLKFKLKNHEDLFIDAIVEKINTDKKIILITGFNISDEISKNKELKKRKEEFKLVFNNYEKAFLWIDIETEKIVNCNASTLKLFEITNEELLNLNFLEIYADNMKSFYSQLFKKDSLKKLLTNFEVQIKTPLGENKSVYLNTRIINIENKIILQKEFIELTDDKKELLNLIRIQKLESINFFASGITHNFNNIMAAISGNLQLASMYVKNNVKIKNKIEELQNISNKGELLIKNFLKFSKKFSEEKSLIKLDIFLKDYFKKFQNMNIVIEDSPDNFSSLFDPKQFENILDILMNEIFAEIDGNNKLNIFIQEFNNVEDNSNKIKTGKYNIINLKYEYDFKNMIIINPHFESTLNFSILKSITANFGGYISHEIINNKSSNIRILIPSIISNNPKTFIQKTKSESKPRILLMDDEEMILTIAEELLTEMGYEVTTCFKGEEAIELYKNRFETDSSFHVFITDLTVKNGMGGLEASEIIKLFHNKAKIIVSSGYSNNEIMLNYKKYGFLEKINKPYDLEKMEKTLIRIINYEA